MNHFEAGDIRGTDASRYTRGDFDHVHVEPTLGRAHTWKEDFHRLPKPSRGSDGSRDRERAFSTRELAVEYQERHAGEVVAVQVREHDCVNAVRVYAGTLQTN